MTVGRSPEIGAWCEHQGVTVHASGDLAVETNRRTPTRHFRVVARLGL
jgi:hypothetical protein